MAASHCFYGETETQTGGYAAVTVRRLAAPGVLPGNADLHLLSAPTRTIETLDASAPMVPELPSVKRMPELRAFLESSEVLRHDRQWYQPASACQLRENQRLYADEELQPVTLRRMLLEAEIAQALTSQSVKNL